MPVYPTAPTGVSSWSSGPIADGHASGRGVCQFPPRLREACSRVWCAHRVVVLLKGRAPPLTQGEPGEALHTGQAIERAVIEAGLVLMSVSPLSLGSIASLMKLPYPSD